MVLLLNNSNPRTPALEWMNFIKAGPQQVSPQHVAYDRWNYDFVLYWCLLALSYVTDKH